MFLITRPLVDFLGSAVNSLPPEVKDEKSWMKNQCMHKKEEEYKEYGEFC